MRLGILAFLTGVLVVQQFSVLPAMYWSFGVVMIVLSMRIAPKKILRLLCIVLSFLLGFSWCLGCAHLSMASRLATNLEGKPLQVSGFIASIPDTNHQGTVFLFALKQIQDQDKIIKASGLIRLSLRDANIKLSVGDEWSFNVRLKKTYGMMNPGGFDFEAFAFQENIKAKGNINTRMPYHRLSSHWYRNSIDRIRQYFKNIITQNLPQSTTSQWITALSIGIRNDISRGDWQILQKTGTNHLMAIAGLHIGFMAALAHFFVASLWRCVPYLALRMPAVAAGSVAGLLMAFLYSAMAGFSVPTQRACLMLTIFLMMFLSRRVIPSWQAYCLALLSVLIVNPLTTLSISFWLSFGTVAFIIYGVSGRLGPAGLWWKWGRIQWVITLGLLPLSIWLFQQFSIMSFVANAIAIPVVEFMIVPLCVSGCFLLLFSVKLGIGLLSVADKILSILWEVLTKLAHLPHAIWYQSLPLQWQWILAIVGIIFLLAPMGFPGRYLGFIWLLPLLLFKNANPKENEAWLTLLDVGQGLSAIVQTKNHVLVYDAGAKLGTNFDMGESVVAPYLHAIGAKQIDRLVVSHGDNDHIGGVGALLEHFHVLTIKTSSPEKIKTAQYCLQGTHWNWDGVDFAFLYPSAETLGLDNDSSCVLRVSVGSKHILFTGDIEKFAEEQLVSEKKSDLQADILVAPHHGSKTSGLTSFIEAVNPRYVLFAVGYRNRYHFPHASVVQKYQKNRVIMLETAKTGAIQFKLSGTQTLQSPELYRLQHHHYWNNIS